LLRHLGYGGDDEAIRFIPKGMEQPVAVRGRLGAKKGARNAAIISGRFSFTGSPMLLKLRAAAG
jgi:hypothetical protein